MKKSITIILLLFVGLYSCEKDRHKLPPITQVGNDILACKVNGAAHIYSGKPTLFNSQGVSYDRFADEIRIRATSHTHGDNIEIVLPYMPDSVKTGVKYYFNSPQFVNPTASYYIDDEQVYEIRIPSGFIQFNRCDRTVGAGIFEFTAYFGDDSVQIREGRFDIAAY